MKPVIVSGIQPTGRLHLGNYLGALKNFVDLQNLDRYQSYFFIADLHSLTENVDPKQKARQILELTADYLAAGLNPKKSVIFIQSDISAHTELAWIFNTIAYFGELSRMTQFKEKSKDQKQNNNVGLFTYPLLMAADVLLYDAKYVPVGEDQLQHLELIRELSRRFNKRFGKTFTEPQPLITETSKIMSLKNPMKKMSKSDPDGCLFISDSTGEIKNKIMASVTDSDNKIKYDEKRKPGVSNLLEIYSALSGKNTKALESQFEEKNYSDFKQSLAEVISGHFSAYRQKRSRLIKSKATLEKAARLGSKIAGKVAHQKMAKIRSRLGLL